MRGDGIPNINSICGEKYHHVSSSSCLPGKNKFIVLDQGFRRYFKFRVELACFFKTKINSMSVFNFLFCA